MDRPRLIRGLRIAWSVWWGILCVLLVVLWVRSFKIADILNVNITGSFAVQFYSARGLVAVSIPLPDTPYNWISLGLESIPGLESLERGWGFTFDNANQIWTAIVPNWFPLIVCTVVAALPWMRGKYSLRTLLIATTLIAVVMGVVVWATR